MYKGSIEIATINKSMKIKFNLIIKDDQLLKTGNYGKVIDMFRYRGSEYLKISPKPYVTIDISKTASDKNEKNEMIWNSNSVANLNKISLYDFQEKLKTTILEFTTIEDLFFIKDGKLFINKDRANEHIKIIITNNKTVILRHAVVIDHEDGREYEGVVLYINESANFSTLTYKEAKYLYYEISKINMHELSMALINAYLRLNEKENNYKELKINKVIEEKLPEEITEKQLPKIIKTNEIPENI